MYTLFRLIYTLLKNFVNFREMAVTTTYNFMDNPMLIWFSLIKLVVVVVVSHVNKLKCI